MFQLDQLMLLRRLLKIHPPRDHAHEFHEDVQGGTGSVLAGIADRVADHCRGVGGVLAAVGEFFAAEIAFFNVLFGIVPGSAGIVERAGQREPGSQTAREQTHDPGDAEDQSGQDRDDDCQLGGDG